MEPSKGDSPKLPDMVMCGDHPSITKTELNAKDDRVDDKPLDKDKKDRPIERPLPMSYARISPSSSRTERVERVERAERAPGEQKPRVMSEHALRLMETRRYLARSTDVLSRSEDVNTLANKALVQAALGSFRWPPYLVAVWVLVLVLTHVLHCLVTMLERALPSLKKLCTYFRTWAEWSWRCAGAGSQRLSPLALGALTALLYAAYGGLCALHAAALWAVQPLAGEEREREDETRVTDYNDIDAAHANK